jgi:hypothetical protein
MKNEELDFLAFIYEGFLNTENDETKKFLWKLNTITNTMKFSNDQTNDGFCENALRMIMTLFHNYIIDESEIESKSICEPHFDERDLILPILIEEFV